MHGFREANKSYTSNNILICIMYYYNHLVTYAKLHKGNFIKENKLNCMIIFVDGKKQIQKL